MNKPFAHGPGLGKPILPVETGKREAPVSGGMTIIQPSVPLACFTGVCFLPCLPPHTSSFSLLFILFLSPFNPKVSN